MSDAFLPPGCTLRPARSGDRWAIWHLLRGFKSQEMPMITWRQRLWRWLGLGIILAILLHWTLTVGLSFLLLQYGVGMASAIALGFLANLVLQLQSWSRFWVVECNGRLVACVKVRSYTIYAVMTDVFVLPEWRRQKIGSFLVQTVAEKSVKPLYLTCLPHKLDFYTRLGFVQIPLEQLSLVVRNDLGIPYPMNVIPLVMEQRT